MRQHPATILGHYLKTAKGRRLLADSLKSRRLVEQSFPPANAEKSRRGDHGKGFLCRWRKDMVPMLKRIHELRDRIELRHQDGLEVLREFDSPENYAFVDPPYSAGEDSQGPTLYREHDLDHVALFGLMSEWRGRWQMTYDLCLETLSCGHPKGRYLILHPEAGIWKSLGVKFQKVQMLTGMNKKTFEVVVTSRE